MSGSVEREGRYTAKDHQWTEIHLVLFGKKNKKDFVYNLQEVIKW
jgi:hypothetical protein